MQRHHMGISGIRSKQLCAPYGVSRARWVKEKLFHAQYQYVIEKYQRVVQTVSGSNLEMVIRER